MAPGLNRVMGCARAYRDNGATAAAQHMWKRRAHGIKNAFQINVDYLVPSFGISTAEM